MYHSTEICLCVCVCLYDYMNKTKEIDNEASYFLNVLSDGIFASPLAYFCDICTTESLSVLGKGSKVNIFGDWRFPQAGLEYLVTRILVW